MQTGRRFRLYPTPEQASVLRRWIGGQRFVYNAKIENYQYESCLQRHAILSPSWENPDPSQEKIFNQSYSHLRQTNPWMFEVPAEVFRNGAYRYRKAVIKCAQGAGPPTRKKKHGRQSVLLTSECFSVKDNKLTIASRKQNIGVVAWKNHREFTTPKMISISQEPNGHWFAGFSCEDGITPPQLQMPEKVEDILGCDMGVAQSITTAKNQVFHPSKQAIDTHTKKEKQARKLQRKLARQKKGSQNRKKTKHRLARVRARQANLRRDFAHKTSFALCQGPHKAIAFEDIRLQNLTKAPKPKQDEDGKYIPNGAAAKAGLNASLLRWSLGLIRSLTAQKAPRFGKHFLLVPAAYSSQECSSCHFTSHLNRPSQAEFFCQACGTTLHADHNGSKIIAHRGFILISAGNRQIPPAERASHAMTQEAPSVRKG